MEGGYAVAGGSKSPAPLTWNDFLERMRHPSAADFVKSIKSFIITFSNKVPDPDRDTTAVQEFLATTEGAFRNHALWAGCSEAELESAGEGLEKYLMTKLYNRTFASYPEDIKHDKELFEKVSLVQQFICPEHLDIKPTFQNERAWLLAQKELQKINTYKAPRDKLVCILNCCKVINNLLLNASIASPDNPPGADDFLPILIYVTIKANPPQLHSNLLYIQRYRLQSRMMSEAAYFFTNILSAESFISNIDAKSLLMDEEEFRQKMEFAQAQLDKPTNSESDIDKIKPDIVEQQTDMLKSKGDVSDNVDALSQDDGLSKENDDKKQGLVRKLSISDLEKKGAIDLIKENQLSSYFQEYPFLYAISGDLTSDDVEHLLNSYKLLVFKYVSLAKGINLSEISVTVPIDQQRSEAADDSTEGNK